MAALIGVGGALIGAAAAWWAASSTNRIQRRIADRSAELQRQLAADGLALQKRIAEGQVILQRELATDTARAQQRALIDSMLLKMLEFLIEHPHLEKPEFCQKYPDVPGGANARERYEAYCVFVFNLLMTAFRHFDGDPSKLGAYIGLEEIVRCHYRWWQLDKENLWYDEPFRRCIQSVIDKLRREGKIT